MKKRFLLIIAAASLSIMLCACDKEPEKTVIDTPLVAAPTTTPAATQANEPSFKDNSEVINEQSLSEGQQAVVELFYDSLSGDDIGLPNDTMYYKVEAGNRFEIDGKECYEIRTFDPDTNEPAGTFYVEKDGLYVYGYDESQSGYYKIYDESEVYPDDEIEEAETAFSEEASTAMALLRSQTADSLGLPASYNMQECIIQYDGIDNINGGDYFCFFIARDESFSSYFEYYVSIDYSSLLVYDENTNQYYDLTKGEYVVEDGD